MTDDNCAKVHDDVHVLPSGYTSVIYGSRLHLRVVREKLYIFMQVIEINRIALHYLALFARARARLISS